LVTQAVNKIEQMLKGNNFFMVIKPLWKLIIITSGIGWFIQAGELYRSNLNKDDLLRTSGCPLSC